jgi:hypothetical protein
MDGMTEPQRKTDRRRGQRGPQGPRVLVLPYWCGHATYLLYAGFAAVAFVSGVPSLDLSSPEGYRPFWAVALVLGSLAGLIGFIGETPPWNRVELAGSLTVIAFTAAYLYSIAVLAIEGDTARQALAILLFAALVFPVGRLVISARYEGSKADGTSRAVKE